MASLLARERTLLRRLDARLALGAGSAAAKSAYRSPLSDKDLPCTWKGPSAALPPLAARMWPPAANADGPARDASAASPGMRAGAVPFRSLLTDGVTVGHGCATVETGACDIGTRGQAAGAVAPHSCGCSAGGSSAASGSARGRDRRTNSTPPSSCGSCRCAKSCRNHMWSVPPNRSMTDVLSSGRATAPGLAPWDAPCLSCTARACVAAVEIRSIADTASKGLLPWSSGRPAHCCSRAAASAHAADTLLRLPWASSRSARRTSSSARYCSVDDDVAVSARCTSPPMARLSSSLYAVAARSAPVLIAETITGSLQPPLLSDGLLVAEECAAQREVRCRIQHRRVAVAQV